MKTLWEKLAYCAEVDVNLPGSLMCDAWDLINEALAEYREVPYVGQISFESALLRAVDAYLASPLTYEFNRRVG